MNKLLLLFGGILLASFSISQTVVKVDSITKEIKGELPFDQQFYLPVMHTKNEKPVSLRITIYRNGKPSKFSSQDNKRARDTYNTNATIDYRNATNSHMTIKLNESSIISTKEGSLIPIFPLDPATTYSFMISLQDLSYSEKRRGALVAAFDKNGTLETLANDVKGESRDSSQIASLISVSIDEEKYGDAIKAILLNRFIYTEKDRHGEISSDVSKIQEEVAKAVKLENDLSMPNLKEFIEIYNSCNAYLNECDSCSVIHNLYKDKFSMENLLLILDDDHRSAIESGLLNIAESAYNKQCNETDYKKRVQNLKSTYAYIENYYRFHKHLIKNACEVDETLLKDIRTTIKKLLEIIEKWESVTKNAKSIVHDLPIFKGVSNTGFSAGGLTADSKGKFTVRPDFGVVFASNFNGFNAAFPFVGARFNLRPLDPNLPYPYIARKGFWHRSSIGVSFSTNSIADGETRFDLVGKTNLIVDYGFRLNNAMCISAGTVVFKQANPNPLITNQQLAVMPTIGVTIDFSILEAIKDVKTVLTGI